MFTSQLMRIGAILLLVGGIAGVIGAIISPSSPDVREQIADPLFMPAHTLAFLAGLMTVVGLPAAYAKFARDAGWLGAIGFMALMVTGIMLGYFPDMLSLLVLPWVASLSVPASALNEGPPTFFAYFIVASLVALVAALAFGLAIIRTEAYSRWVGYLLILAGIVNLVVGFIPNMPAVVSSLGAILFYISLLWIGAELWQSSEEASAAV